MAEYASKGVAGTALGLGIAGTVTCMQNTLNAITKTVIPNTAICPGWGNVTITPATTTTTTPAA